MKNAPFTVIIVGRTNVGKSTLFNRLSSTVSSLVLDQEGVTRDFVRETVSWQGASFELIDTGGFSIQLSNDPIQKLVVERVSHMMKEANLALLVVDGSIGVLPEDKKVAQALRAYKIPTIVVVNKYDVKSAQEYVHEFRQLGSESYILISAAHGTGIADLLEKIVQLIPKKNEQLEDLASEPVCKVAIIGKPNVGKSSLLNALLKKDRAIVTDIAGTTREPLAERIQFYKESFEIIDTPGVRRKASVNEQLEEMMVKSTMGALKDANVILYVIDGAVGTITDQEFKLLFYAFDQHNKAVIVLYNKQDLVQEEALMARERVTDEYKFFFKKLESLSLSCVSGKNVGKVMPLVEKVWKRYSQTLPDHELTMLCKDALAKKPLFNQQQELRLYGVKQVKTAPITLVFQVNQAHLFGTSQLAFFEGILRAHYDLKSVPLVLIPRTRS